METDLEFLIKSWDAFVNCTASEAERLRQLYDEKVNEIAQARKLSPLILDRAVQRAHQRWQWADDPKFPRDLRKIRFD